MHVSVCRLVSCACLCAGLGTCYQMCENQTAPEMLNPLRVPPFCDLMVWRVVSFSARFPALSVSLNAHFIVNVHVKVQFSHFIPFYCHYCDKNGSRDAQGDNHAENFHLALQFPSVI